MIRVFTTDRAPPQPLVELARVKTRRALRQGEDAVPAGALGTIVHVYEQGQAFEVEFSTQQVVLTALGSDLDRA